GLRTRAPASLPAIHDCRQRRQLDHQRLQAAVDRHVFGRHRFAGREVAAAVEGGVAAEDAVPGAAVRRADAVVVARDGREVERDGQDARAVVALPAEDGVLLVPAVDPREASVALAVAAPEAGGLAVEAGPGRG